MHLSAVYVHYVCSCNWITISHVRLQIDHLNYPPIIAGDINIRRIIFTLTAGVPVCVHLAVHLCRPQCVHLSHIRHLRDTTCELVGQNIHTHSVLHSLFAPSIYVSLCLFLASVLPLTFFLLHITCSSSVLHLAYTISHLKPPIFRNFLGFFHSSPPSPPSLSPSHTHTHTHYTPPPPHSLTIYTPSSSQEHWNVRSKGLLQDFANSHLGRVRVARARAYSGTGDSTDEEDKDYDMIRGALILSLFT